MMVHPSMAKTQLSIHDRAHHTFAHTSHFHTHLSTIRPAPHDLNLDILPLLGMPITKPPSIPPQTKSHQPCTKIRDRSQIVSSLESRQIQKERNCQEKITCQHLPNRSGLSPPSEMPPRLSSLESRQIQKEKNCQDKFTCQHLPNRLIAEWSDPSK